MPLYTFDGGVDERYLYLMGTDPFGGHDIHAAVVERQKDSMSDEKWQKIINLIVAAPKLATVLAHVQESKLLHCNCGGGVCEKTCTFALVNEALADLKQE